MNAQANDINDKVRELQRALYRAAKVSARRRFHALADKVVRQDILRRAWEVVAANGGAAGVDGTTIAAIQAAGVAEFLTALATDLRTGRYRPQRVRRVFIPKPDGRQRPLGIPTVRDRVVQMAVKIVIEPIFEADFRPSSYGFRPRRSAHQALEQIRLGVNGGAVWVVDADIEAFFDRIDQTTLLGLVARRISDRQILKWLRHWLEAGVLLPDGTGEASETGVPQGGVISPLLANIVLHELDRAWEDGHRALGELVRYADDFVILCRTEAAAKEALRRVTALLGALGLTLHPTKTRVVGVRGGSEGFDFLGFHHRQRPSRRWPGRWYLNRWPGRKAVQRFRDRVRAITAPRSRLPEPIRALIATLNPVIRGWGAYFRVGNASHVFAALDSYVRERLGLWLRRKRRKRSSRWEGMSPDFCRQHGLAVLSGTLAWSATPTAVR